MKIEVLSPPAGGARAREPCSVSVHELAVPRVAHEVLECLLTLPDGDRHHRSQQGLRSCLNAHGAFQLAPDLTKAQPGDDDLRQVTKPLPGEARGDDQHRTLAD